MNLKIVVFFNHLVVHKIYVKTLKAIALSTYPMIRFDLAVEKSVFFNGTVAVN